MTEQLRVSLRPLYAPDKENGDLKSLIERISQQGGSFREVTEAKLEGDIRNAESGVVDDEDPVLDITAMDGVGESKARQEEVLKAREEMIKLVSQARNESAMALDFVSLLLSKHAAASGLSTMSPYIQQHVPAGSLNVEATQPPTISEAEQRNLETVSMGWRMQSLGSAADILLASANRLRTEIEKETTYWAQVLTVKEKGWSVSRLPREKHTLAVRYGFAEAHADFRDRGLAALRRDSSGDLFLDRRPQSTQNQQLRVRILDRGKFIASSKKSAIPAAAGSRDITQDTDDVMDDDESVLTSIATDLLQARDHIFDAELHLESHREARSLLSHNVRCDGSRVLIPYGHGRQIEVDLIDSDFDHESDTNDSTQQAQFEPHSQKPWKSTSVTATSTTLPNGMLLVLRLLLSQAHRKHLHDRSSVPAPLKGATKARPVYALLKPIVLSLEGQTSAGSRDEGEQKGLVTVLKLLGEMAGGLKETS